MAGTVSTFGGQIFVLLNPVAIAEIMRSPTGPVMRHVIVVAERVKREAIHEAPKRTGNMSEHIVKRIARGKDGEPNVLVGVENVPYAYWVHEGSREHDVYPVNASVLAWQGADGQTVFAMHAHIPARPPNRFLVRALRAVTTT